MVNARTTPEYWQQETGSFYPFKVEGHPFGAILEKYLPNGSDKSCLEVGAYPGANLCYLAKRFGFKPYAIEYRPDANDISCLFRFNGQDPPVIFQGDFLKIRPGVFDVVTSYGFVEHFNDPEVVIERHVELMAPHGSLVISVPHFGGMQGSFRRLVYTRQALTELHVSHNLKIMNLSALKSVLQVQGLKIIYADYSMNGRFWVDPKSPKIKPGRRWLARVLSLYDRAFGAWLPSCSLFSPMILLICRKE